MAIAKRWTPRASPRRGRIPGTQPAPGIAFVSARVSCTACGLTLETFALAHGPVEILCATCGTFREAVPVS